MALTRLQHGRDLHNPGPDRDKLESLREFALEVADGIGGLEDLLEAQAEVLSGRDTTPDIFPVITGTAIMLRLLREELEGICMDFADEIKAGAA